MIRKISSKRKKWGSLSDYKKVCTEIYEERNKQCEKCGTYIYELKYHNINHKSGRRKNFLNKNELELLCFTCHSKHHGIEVKNGEWLN